MSRFRPLFLDMTASPPILTPTHRAFAAAADGLASRLLRGQEQEQASSSSSTTTPLASARPSCLTSALLQDRPISERALASAGVSSLSSSDLSSFSSFAASFAKQSASSPESTQLADIYQRLTPSERIAMDRGTLSGRDAAAIASRLSLDRLAVVNSLIVYEFTRQLYSIASYYQKSITTLSDEEKQRIVDRMRERARRLLLDAWSQEGVVPLLAHPRRSEYTARAMVSDMVYIPMDMPGQKDGESCHLAGFCCWPNTQCPLTNKPFKKCCGLLEEAEKPSRRGRRS